MFNDDIIYPPTKDYIPQPLYVCQPYSLQIIQLVECSPPPPQQQQRQKYTPSMISSSSYSDSSESESDSSAYDSSSSSLFAGSSYCSSAAEDSAAPAPPSFDNRDPSVDDTYRTRQRRVSLWRDAVHSKNVANSGSSVALVGVSFLTDPWLLLSTRIYHHHHHHHHRSSIHPSNRIGLNEKIVARPASPSQKRKCPEGGGDLANGDSVVSDNPSHASSPIFHFANIFPQTSHAPRKSPRSTLSAHSCPACDEDFSSPLGLRQHASASRNANDACRIAVEYGFEQ